MRNSSMFYFNISINSLAWERAGVTSSCLCKKAEGVVLPLLVESVKDGIKNSLHALHVGEQDHGPGAPANFHEAGSARRELTGWLRDLPP